MKTTAINKINALPVAMKAIRAIRRITAACLNEPDQTAIEQINEIAVTAIKRLSLVSASPAKTTKRKEGNRERI